MRHKCALKNSRHCALLTLKILNFRSKCINVFLSFMFSIFVCEFFALPPFGTQRAKSISASRKKQQVNVNVSATRMMCSSRLISDLLVRSSVFCFLGHSVCNPMSSSETFIVKLSLDIFIRELNQVNLSQPKNILKKPSSGIKAKWLFLNSLFSLF